MHTVISVLIVVVCILLALIVLVQNSKGGGLASNFSSSNQIMGVRKTTDFLEKATWTLAAAMIGLSLLAGFAIPRGNGGPASLIDEHIETSVDPARIPAFPSSTPVMPPVTDPAGATEETAPQLPELP